MNEWSKPRPALTRVTLLDVARASGVSKSSVSRFLDERLPKSDSEVAQRVRKVADELGYVRDISAASLRRGKTNTIGVIVPRLTDTVMAMFYEAVSRACTRADQFAFVATTDDAPLADRSAARRLISQGVDGLILTTARLHDTLADDLEHMGVPFALALRTDGRSPSSVGDDRLGGYLATRHLIDLGHSRIALIAGPDYASSSRERQQGYFQAMEEARLTVRPEWVMPSTFGIESGAEAAENLMALEHCPTAIFAVNDNTAIGALSALGRLGLVVPRDVSVVGYNDIPIVSLLPTPMTSVRVPFDHLATTALDLLRGNDKVSRSSIQVATPTLIPRKTSARLSE